MAGQQGDEILQGIVFDVDIKFAELRPYHVLQGLRGVCKHVDGSCGGGGLDAGAKFGALVESATLYDQPVGESLLALVGFLNQAKNRFRNLFA